MPRPSRARPSTWTSWRARRAPPGLAELVEAGVVAETAPGRGRASGTRSPARRSTPTSPGSQRRALHRRLAEALEAAGARAAEVATHWVGAREHGRAREALLRAAAESRAVHALPRRRARGAAGARAVARGRGRTSAHRGARGVREQLPSCPASSPRRPARGARSARSARTRRARERSPRPSAGWRPSATCRGDRAAALAARRAAADAFAAADRPAEAAVERLAMANYMRAEASYSAAIELARGGRGGRRARRAARPEAARAAAWRASRSPSAATSRAGSRPCAAGWRSRSSTT